MGMDVERTPAHQGGIDAASNDVSTSRSHVEMEYQLTNHNQMPSSQPEPADTRTPLVKAWHWWKSWGLPGMGMFSIAYMIFAIGNITPFLAAQYPQCWGNVQPPDCNQTTVDQLTTVEICGIIFGMLSFGLAADIIGRKWGSRVTGTLMLIGSALLTGAYGTTPQQFLSVFSFSLFFFGTGVGGDYPLTASSAAEKAEEGGSLTKKRRGQLVVLTFSQQGWGNLANVATILLFMLMTGATSDPISATDGEIIWRSQFAVGTCIILGLALHRWIYLGESKMWEKEKRGEKRTAADVRSSSNNSKNNKQQHYKRDTMMIMESGCGSSAGIHSLPPHESNTTTTISNNIITTTTSSSSSDFSWNRHWVPTVTYYYSRMIITCLGWTCNDTIFYGQRLFSFQFISIISPGSSTFEIMLWTLLNSGIGLVGYIAAAMTIDKKWYGRRRMQGLGFFMLALLFLLCGVFYDTLTDPGSSTGTQVFQFLYFFSSFWVQFGPNCTTFLVAGEVYPTKIRGVCHGVSAAMGKVGAIIATQLLTRLSDRGIYYAYAVTGAIGVVLTALFLPDTTGLDLSEIDYKFNDYLTRADNNNNANKKKGKQARQEEEYGGEAVNPKHLSQFEKWMGYGRQYRSCCHNVVHGVSHGGGGSSSVGKRDRGGDTSSAVQCS